jgi:DNA-directed RNA polymerase specialized sigma24 family protein
MEMTVGLTRDSLEKLLIRLDHDRERAAEKYETLRLGLVRFFEWRGCAFPEDHADEAIDRVAGKIVQGEEIRNIHSYTTGVARFVFMEIVKDREKQQAALRQLPSNPVAKEPPDEDGRMECVRSCLRSLPPESSQLLMAYYQDETRNRIELRKRLARQLGISPHTLRMRLQRLRAKLEECVVDCVSRGSSSSNAVRINNC